MFIREQFLDGNGFEYHYFGAMLATSNPLRHEGNAEAFFVSLLGA